MGHDLSHIVYKGSGEHGKAHVALMVSKWNPKITKALKQGAIQTLTEAGVNSKHIYSYEVPGTYELPQAANMLLNRHKYLHAVICIGCVIQGETKHFDFIAQAVAQGITQVGIAHQKPVIFGVLTPNNMQQAEDRAGGKYGNKGQEAAVAALEMLDLMYQL